jgi:hypothetical protein
MKPLRPSAQIMACAVIGSTMFFPMVAEAIDCSTEPPFQSLGSVKARVSLAHWYRATGSQNKSEEDVCTKDITLSIFDVRGREESAYYCLKPFPEEVVVCETTLNDSPAEFAIVPAIWQRTARNRTLIETRFHAYVQDKKNPQAYLDIFSRSLNPPPLPEEIILEGSLRSGSASPLADDYWVRMEIFGNKTAVSVR